MLVPVRFDCQGCGEGWWAPPANGCPRCGYDAAATPDPVIWTVGQVPRSRVFISAQLRDAERFATFVRDGIGVFVDVAGDAPYVWRPDPTAVEAAGIIYRRISAVEDTNIDLPDSAFEAVARALEDARHTETNTLLFCAAGLKRSPHLLYGVLRRQGLPRGIAWDAVRAARPFVEPFEPYIAAADRWVASRRPAVASR
jgi:hypothetical protein